jgi:hypothetical protein
MKCGEMSLRSWQLSSTRLVFIRLTYYRVWLTYGRSQLIAKGADHRYQSCYGLKADLIECQRLLLASVHTGLGHDISELIPAFPIGGMDRFMVR